MAEWRVSGSLWAEGSSVPQSEENVLAAEKFSSLQNLTNRLETFWTVGSSNLRKTEAIPDWALALTFPVSKLLK